MKVLIFSPHPDDAEVLMGGTIAKYTSKGHGVTIVLVTVPDQEKRRKEESEKSASILRADLRILGLNSRELIFNRCLVEIFDNIFEELKPEIVYTSWLHDSHQDHGVVCRATIAMARKNHCSLYMYDQALPSGLTPFAFRGQAFVDIADTMETKIKSVSAYKSQLERYGQQWIDGIIGRAAYLGSRIDAKYAEEFEVIRQIKEIQ